MELQNQLSVLKEACSQLSKKYFKKYNFQLNQKKTLVYLKRNGRYLDVKEIANLLIKSKEKLNEIIQQYKNGEIEEITKEKAIEFQKYFLISFSLEHGVPRTSCYGTLFLNTSIYNCVGKDDPVSFSEENRTEESYIKIIPPFRKNSSCPSRQDVIQKILVKGMYEIFYFYLDYVLPVLLNKELNLENINKHNIPLFVDYNNQETIRDDQVLQIVKIVTKKITGKSLTVRDLRFSYADGFWEAIEHPNINQVTQQDNAMDHSTTTSINIYRHKLGQESGKQDQLPYIVRLEKIYNENKQKKSSSSSSSSSSSNKKSSSSSSSSSSNKKTKKSSKKDNYSSDNGDDVLEFKISNKNTSKQSNSNDNNSNKNNAPIFIDEPKEPINVNGQEISMVPPNNLDEERDFRNDDIRLIPKSKKQLNNSTEQSINFNDSDDKVNNKITPSYIPSPPNYFRKYNNIQLGIISDQKIIF